MSCCYRDGKGWCKNLDRVYTDADGKDYCVFHAPQGEKRVLLEKFNERVFERIREAQRQDEPCDLSGTVFEGNITFSQFDENNPLPEIEFSKAQFKGDAEFTNVHFSDDARFFHTKFSRDAYFKAVLFSGDISFRGVQFSGNASFTFAQFNKDADFESIQFGESVGFAGVCFNGNTSFDFIHIPKKGRILFQEWMKGKNFLQKASFEYLDVEGSLIFEGVDLSKTIFGNTRMDNIDFVNVRWSKSGLGAWRNTLYDEINLLEKIKKVLIQDEASVQGEERPKTLYTDFENWMERTFYYAEKFSDDIRKVETLYRRMKNKYRTLQNWPEVSNWHYGEKEMYRKENAFRRYFPFSFSFLYWLSSGYGERYVRAGVSLVVLIVVLSVGLAWTGLDAAALSGSNPGDFHGITSITLKTLDLKSIGALLINTLKYATFQKDIIFFPRNMWGEIVRLLAQILIPIQTALFIMAVRNRFRR